MSHRTPCNPFARLLGALALIILAAGPVRAQVINEPPLDPISIIAFPSRDFVSTSGWLATDHVTIEVIRNGLVVSASPAILTLDGLADVNHPGNVCWGAVTPDLRVGDIVRGTARDAAGAVRGIHQTHVSGVTNQRAVLVQPDDPNTILGEGVIRIHGTAYGANGQPLPIDQLESRIIANSPSKWRFSINGGRRTLRASLSHPDLEGVISYDTADNPLGGNWTATYSGLVEEDVTIVMGGLSRLSGLVYDPATACCLWLGVNPLTVNESTIYENDDVNIPGPAAGACFNPLEALDVTPPSQAFQFNMAPSATGAVTLSWGAATDDWSVAYYQITRNGQPIANVPPTSFSYVDATPPAGVNTYGMRVYDHATPLGAGVDPVQRIIAGFGRVYGNVSALDTLSAPRDFAPPTVPANLVVVSKPGQAQLSWAASTDNVGVASYRVYRSGVAVGDVAAPATSYVDAITVSGTYTYTVDAADAAGNRSAASAGVTSLVRIPADIVPPGAPTLAAAIVTSTTANGTVTLNWTPAVDNVAETGYAIYRDGALVDSVLVPTTTWTQAGVAFGTYSYQVDAYDAPFNHGAKSAAVTAVVTPPAPEAPTALSHTTTVTPTGANLVFSWTPAVDLVNETGYGIYRDGVLVDSVLAPATSYSASVAFGRYAYQVDAYVAGVNRSVLSGVDSVIVIPPPVPGAPTALSHTTTVTPTGANLVFSWTPAVDLAAETGYGIYRDGVLVDSVLAPATSYSASVVFGRYAYQVDAYVAGVNRSVLSGVDSAIVIAPPPPPAIPGAPTALAHTTTVTPTGANLVFSWTPAVDLAAETGYGIYRDGVLVDSVLAPATSYSASVVFGRYAYQVDAYVAGVNRSVLSGVDSAIVIAPPPPPPPPAIPGAPTALAHTTTVTPTGANLVFSWTPAVDLAAETGYGIYRDGVLVDSVLAPATSYSASVVFGRYAYQVDAYVAGVNRSVLSGVDSAIVIAPPPPPPPPAIPGAPTALAHTTTATPTGANLVFSWTPAVDLVNETGYGIYRNGVLVDSVLAPATSYSASVVFGRYAYQVDSYVAGVNRSVRSGVDSAIVIAPPPPPPPPVVIGAPGVPTSGATAGNMTVSTGNAIGNSTLPFGTNWTSSASAGVTRYQLQMSTNSAAWVNVTTASPLATSHVQALAIGTTTAAGRRNYQYRVRAIAGADTSAWAIGQRFGVTAVDNGSGSITYGGTWTTNNRVTGAYGASTRSATAATASATYRTAVLAAPGSVAWVTSKGPGRGRALVSVDGGPAVTVDLYAPTTTTQAVVAFTTPLSAGVAHTIRIAPAGSRNVASTSNRIDVDAFMLVTAQAGITPAALAPAALETETEVQPTIGRLSFAPISPNPSRGVATLSFGLPRDGEVEIGIVDVQGRQVRNLHRGSMASGPHTLVWDGRSSSGQSSAPGIYFAVLRFSNETRTQRIVRVP